MGEEVKGADIGTPKDGATALARVQAHLRAWLPQAGRLLLRFLPLALATLLLALGLFLAWQAWLTWRVERGVEAADRVRATAVETLAARVRRMGSELAEALVDPRVQALLREGPAQREAAALALQARLPAATEVEFFSPELGEVLSGNLGNLGYAKAAALLQAKVAPKQPLAEMRMQPGVGRQLMFALPVEVDGTLVAFVVVEWPFAPILESFSRAAAEDVRLELRQGTGRGDLVIAGTGSGSASTLTDLGVVVPGTRLRIGKAAPDYFIVVPRNPLLVGALSLLCLLGTLLALWLRRVGLAGAIERLQRRPDTEPEITLSQALNQHSDGTPAPAAVPKPAPAPASEEAVEVDPSIFRMYDIRGVVGKSLTPAVARLIGRAIGSEARARDLREIVVGRDGRLSGPDMVAALIAGLRSTGMDVIDIGAVPTPLTYFAGYHLRTGSGISVTGSHNPPDYNGFKVVLGGETLSEDAIHALYRRIAEHRFVDGMGGLQAMDIGADYLRRVSEDIQIERPLKVVVDCGNGIPGAFAPALLEAIGCEVEALYCEVDGTFPNHHPDPSEPENLKDLILAVQKTGADIGLAFDGDGDRLGVVTASGEMIFPDRLLMLFAMDILTRNPGATIIYDVKCTGHLQPLILQHGGSPLMWRTGHSLIKAKMRETDAALAGEMSGHFFFSERWFGFDDGLYSAARLMEILAADPEERSPQAIFDTLPKGVSTPELKVAMAEGANHGFIEAFREQAVFEGARLTSIDGVRADWPDGWGLVRASNTTPVLVLRFDADDAPALARIQDVFRRQLLAVDPALELPF